MMASDVTADIKRKLIDGSPAERVEALDVLTHALDFARPPDALVAWRLALHERVVADGAVAALDTLVGYLMDQYARGNPHAASTICDCLAYVAPAADRLSRGQR